jgi:hypothetical protein
MRRKPGISLYHPPARKPTVMRRYGAFAGIGLLVGAVAGLGLTQMPVGQVAAVTSSSKKGCIDERARVDRAKRCDRKSNRSRGETSTVGERDPASPERP